MKCPKIITIIAKVKRFNRLGATKFFSRFEVLETTKKDNIKTSKKTDVMSWEIIIAETRSVIIRSSEREDLWDIAGRPPQKPLTSGLKWSMRQKDAGREPHLEPSPSKGRRWTEHGPWTDNPKGWLICGYGPFRRLTGHASDAQCLYCVPAGDHQAVRLIVDPGYTQPGTASNLA